VPTFFFDTIFGIPTGKQDRERAYRNVVGDMKPADAFARILGGMQHNTDKAGALLAAQGIFAVACTFAIDHGWPRLLALSAILLLLAGALLAMSILRSTAAPFHAGSEADVPRIAFRLLISRMIRFNLALYMTFVSILLLGIAAVSFVL
jgi:hypothetical protein